MKSSRRIGLLGGMSWESSVAYERLLNEEMRRRLGGTHSADLIVRSYDFATIEALQEQDRWDAAGALLSRDAQLLEAGGAELILLCTNTMHRVAERIERSLQVPFLHIGDAVAEAVVAAGVSNVALLGTRYTMEQAFYRSRLQRHGLGVSIPDEAGREKVHRVIYDELVQGRIEPASRDAMVAIVEDLVRRGARGVIAGCTEIELLLRPEDLSVPLFPSMRLHALAAVERALA